MRSSGDAQEYCMMLIVLNDDHLKYRIRCIEKENKQIANMKSGNKFNNMYIINTIKLLYF